MKGSFLLALSFTAAVGDVAAQTCPSQYCCANGNCPETVVRPSDPVPAFQFGTGLWGRIGGGITWDNSPSDASSGGGMSPMPTDPESGRDGICVQFAFRGLPPGCTRQAVAQPGPILSQDDFSNDFGWLAFSTNLPQPIVQEWADLRGFFNDDFTGISGMLGACYADPTQDVSACERMVVTRINNDVTEALADYPWMIASAQYQYRGLNRLFGEVSDERWWVDMFGNDIGVNIGPLEIPVNDFQSAIMSSRFNNFIVARRKYDNCNRIIQLYDRYNCEAI